MAQRAERGLAKRSAEGRAFGLALLYATISFTLPSFNASDDGCSEGLTPLTDLDSCIVTGRTFHGDYRVTAFPCRGLEGWRFEPTVPDSFISASVMTVDRAGNRSCPSPFVHLSGAASVAPAPPDEAPLRPWLDVAGRRMEPGPSGVYLRGQRKVRRVR